MIEFLFILNGVLISRFRLMFKDEGMTGKDAVIIFIIQFLSLLFFKFNFSWVLFLIYLILHQGILYFIEQRTKKVNLSRLISLGIHILIVGLFVGYGKIVSLNTLSCWLETIIVKYHAAGTLLKNINWLETHTIILGLLLVMTEMNLIVRFMFDLLGLKPLNKNKQIDKKEFNTGRIIGMLERIFIYIFVLFGQYAALGFVLAAKGLARFQDFKDRAFAEYVLIGTLLSTLCAMIIGILLKPVLT